MPVVRPAAVASMTTGPTSAPVMVLVATPLAAVAVPVPVTVPAPDCLAKVTTVVLSAVTVLPAASWIVAVSTRVAPEVRLVVAPVSAIWAAAPWTTVKAPSVPVVRPRRGGLHDDGADERAGDRLGGDAAAAVAVPVPVTVPAPDCLAKVTTVVLSAVTVLPAASRMRGGEDAGRAGGEVRGGTRQRDVGGGAVDDREGAERAGREPGGRRLHHDGADERAGDRLGRDAGSLPSRCPCR